MKRWPACSHLIWGATVFAAAAMLPLRAQAPEARVEVRVPVLPVPARVAGRTVLAYELHITNFLPSEIALDRIEVLGGDAGAPVASLRDEALRGAMVQPVAGPTAGDARRLGGGARANVYLWLPFETLGAVPRSLRHKFSFMVMNADGKAEARSLETPPIEVALTAPPVIAPPFRGGTWVALNGPSNESIHRRASLLAGGEFRIAQRFAIDWARLGDDGKAWHGDSKANASWDGYGVEVLAVADGVVSFVRDGIPENVPLSPTRAVPITFETIGGNQVGILLGGRRFAFYAHLQPGSLRVKKGDRVRRGQVLGLLGNSGNSDAPHLHFQICDANDMVRSEGLPYVFDRFQQSGVADLEKTLTEGWTAPPGGRQEQHLREIPSENAVVRFP